MKRGKLWGSGGDGIRKGIGEKPGKKGTTIKKFEKSIKKMKKGEEELEGGGEHDAKYATAGSKQVGTESRRKTTRVRDREAKKGGSGIPARQ